MAGILKNILKLLLIFILSLMLLIAGLISWVVENPKSAWKIVEKHFLPQDLKVSWDKIDFQFKYLSHLNFYFAVEFQDLSIQKGQPFLDLPIEFLRLEASVYPRNTENKIVVHNGQLRSEKPLRFGWSSQNKKKAEKNPFEYLQESLSVSKNFFRLIKVENLDIQAKQIDLAQKDRIFLTLSLDVSSAANILKYKTTLKIPGRQTTSISSRGQLSFPSTEADRLQLTASTAISSYGIKTRQRLKVDYNKNTARIQFQGPLSMRLKKRRISVHAAGLLQLTPKNAEIDLNVTSLQGLLGEGLLGEGLPRNPVKIDSAKAHLISPFDKGNLWSQRPTDFSLLVPIKIFFIDKDMRPPLEKACQCKLPEVLMAHVDGQAWFANLVSQPPRPVPALDMILNLEDVNNKLISLNSEIQLVITKELNKYLINPSIEARAQIHSFQGLRNFLDAKGVLIPAPFSALEGTLDFQMRGPIDISGGYTFPSITSLRLSSEQQKVEMKAQSRIHLQSDFKAAQVQVQALIQQLQLELPPLEPVQGKPRITPDKRILKEPKTVTKPAQFKIAIDAQVKTAQAGGIHLLSRYFEPYLPLALNIQHSSDQNNSGSIRVEPFDIKYLRRKVHVEKMLLTLSSPNGNKFLVEGRLRVEQSQYTVFIDIQGPANKPQVTLSSTPELSRSEIISVLLYDRTSDQLISSDAGTAGNVEAAIVDRAIGLFSLWAFAATPIKGFSYNPSTKVYTATIEIGEDVTASIGTNWEETTQVELRKRISNHWVLTASWAPPDQEEPSKLVLQWENRF